MSSMTSTLHPVADAAIPESSAVRQPAPESTPSQTSPSQTSPSGAQPVASRPAAPAEVTGGLATIDQLLRDRDAILARIRDDEKLVDLARVMLIAIAVTSAVFGAAIGTYRGGIQIFYAAVKFPLLMLLTAAICAPSLTAFNAALDRPSSLRRDLALVLTALALGGLLLVAQAPLILLASSMTFSYHSVILLTFGCCALAGLGSLMTLSRGVRATFEARHRSAVLTLVVVFCVVGAQLAWTLRPYVVRPRTPDVPFVRNIEGSLLESVGTSIDSARGIYTRDAAPLPGEELPEYPPSDEVLYEFRLRGAGGDR